MRRFVLGGVLASLAVPAAASANPTNFASGRAYDVAVKSSLLSTMLTAGPDTGQISTNQTSALSLHAGSLSTSYGSGSLLDASFTTSTERATAAADVASLSLAIPGLPAISGSLISAKSTTSCRNHGTSSGSSALGTLTVNGTTYDVAAPPNTVIPLGALGSITLNEQTPIQNGLTVNAVHVRTVLGTEVVVSSASSAVSNCA
jgi:hypothetical protein